MSAFKIQNTLNEIEHNMTVLAPYRKPALFNEFLVKGYTAVTLSSVPQNRFSEILQAKLYLGTLITLYDDFADRPSQRNPQLLEVLYQLSFQNNNSIKILDHHGNQVLSFATTLFTQIRDILKRMPNYNILNEILNFDLMQFYNANKYSSLLMTKPFISSSFENRLYAHHNMGMVIVAMMDLMASEKVEFSEVGALRKIFLMGQRMGRIFNVLATREREALDNDITGELVTCKSQDEITRAEKNLRQEICDLYNKILSFDSQITTFSVKAYAEGLMKVQTLHEKMKGTI